MIYLAGIDTLLIGFYLRKIVLSEEDCKALSDAKERAKASIFKSSGWLINFKGIDFVMRAAGANPYTYVLQNSDFTLKLAQKITNHAFPEIFIEFRSQFLWRFSYKHAYVFIKEWVAGWSEVADDVVSRADLAIDVSGFPDIKIENIVTRARKRKEHYEIEPIRKGEFYYYGSKQTGYVFGGSSLMQRIYNKSAEVRNSPKEWFHELWQRGGWNGDAIVTRVEMQLRREFLKEFNITTFESFEDGLGDIFRYLTHEWFTLRAPSEDKNKSRWPVTPFWSEIQESINFFGEIYGQTRGKIKQAKEDILLPQAAGLITSIGALREDFEPEKLLHDIKKYFSRKGLTMEDVIEEKKKRSSMFEDGYEPF